MLSLLFIPTTVFWELPETEWTNHPNRFKPLSRQEIAGIFGKGFDKTLGNDLLRSLQMRRVTGTLDHQVELPGIDEEMIAIGLSWLRSNYPLDEDTAIMRRIEDEERMMEEQFITAAKSSKLYVPQASAHEGDVYGKSHLDEIRKANEEKAEEEEMAKVEEQNKEMQGQSETSFGIERPAERVVLSRRTESAQWVEAYKEKARLSKLEEPPDMSKTKRLLPSTIFSVVFIGLCILFAHNYQPPVRHARLFPDTPPAAATILGIIGINVAVLIAWKVPFLWRTLNKHFLLIPATPNFLSLLGNSFSHHGVGHLFTNMFFLWFMGTRLHDEIGRGNFIALYLAGGVFASYVSLARCVLTSSLKTSTLGASGAVISVVVAYLSIHSGDLFGIAFLSNDVSPKISPLILLFMMFAGEVYGLSKGIRQIDHYAHLGGYLTGLAGAEALKYRARDRRRSLNGKAVGAFPKEYKSQRAS